jgi:hypothetical protein
MLTGCFVTPGEFDSQLQIEKSGDFSFSYDGEVFFFGLSKLAEIGAKSETPFVAEECYDENYDQRECSEAELREQRADWEAQSEQRAAKAEKDAEQMAAMMGGIDPSDPEAVEKLRQLLLRHKGWNKVESKGGGVFDVEFAIAGQLSHDMLFPLIEGFPTTSMFVQVILRDDNVVRINAPGFAAQGEGNPMASMMGGMGELAGLAALAGKDADAEAMSEVPVMNGRFTIITDGQILANNTDEGPSIDGAGMANLFWDVDASTNAAPTALIKLGQ